MAGGARCAPIPCPPPSPPRFNLLREESEGYAKLATLLNQQAAGALTPDTTQAVVSGREGSGESRVRCLLPGCRCAIGGGGHSTRVAGGSERTASH